MNMIIKFLKKIIMSSFLIYAFNMVLLNFNVVIPINIYTIIYTSFFDVTSLVILLIFKIIGV